MSSRFVNSSFEGQSQGDPAHVYVSVNLITPNAPIRFSPLLAYGSVRQRRF